MGAKFVPHSTHSISKNLGKDILYFKDSTNAIKWGGAFVEVSTDNGLSWKTVETITSKIVSLLLDPSNPNRAVLFGKRTHYFTSDKGVTWTPFTPQFHVPTGMGARSNTVEFKGEYALISTKYCDLVEDILDCTTVFFYSRDSFKTDPLHLGTDAQSCVFTHFDPEPTLVCLRDRYSYRQVVSSQLVTSSDFFQNEKVFESPLFDSGRIVDIKMELSFLVAVVQKDRYNDKSLISIIVSKDGQTFNKANLKFNKAFGSVRVLASDHQSLILSVLRANSRESEQHGTVYASDSSGLHFRQILDNGDLDKPSKLQYVNGVWFAKISEAGTTIEDPHEDEVPIFGRQSKSSTKISNDNGLTWHKLRLLDDESCKIEDGCSLHLLSHSDNDDTFISVTDPTPGILIGFGVTGENINYNHNPDTYISRGGGLSWTFLFMGAGVHAFGDQGNIIVYVPFMRGSSKPVDTIKFSLDQGKTWSDYQLPVSFYPLGVISPNSGPDATLILSGIANSKESLQGVSYTLEFSGAFDGAKCTDNDMEKVFIRISPEDDRPTCVYGTSQAFVRRKQDSKFLVKPEAGQEIKVMDENFQCTEIDFECSEHFKPSKDGKCVPDENKVSQVCRNERKDVIKLPDMQLSPGNSCDNGLNFIMETEFKCSDFEEIKTEVQIESSFSKLEGKLSRYSYISSKGEYAYNLIARSDEGSIFLSNDGGSNLVRVPIPETALDFYVGQSNGRIVVITDGNFFYLSANGANSFLKLKVPGPLSTTGQTILFHPTNDARFIWISGDCEGSSGCTAYHTNDFGQKFEKLINHAVHCEYVSLVFEQSDEELIYCTVMKDGEFWFLQLNSLRKNLNICLTRCWITLSSKNMSW